MKPLAVSVSPEDLARPQRTVGRHRCRAKSACLDRLVRNLARLPMNIERRIIAPVTPFTPCLLSSLNQKSGIRSSPNPSVDSGLERQPLDTQARGCVSESAIMVLKERLSPANPSETLGEGTIITEASVNATLGDHSDSSAKSPSIDDRMMAYISRAENVPATLALEGRTAPTPVGEIITRSLRWRYSLRVWRTLSSR